MLSLPAPAKLNLQLHITGRRDDGMHLLAGSMVLIDLADTIHLSPRTDGKIIRQSQHAHIAAENDIAVIAARRLQQAAGCSCGVDISIDKKIPLGGGLGGGSSDAATVLMGLNHLWNINWHSNQLVEIAATLGADVPFFFYGKPAHISGIGNIFSAASVNMEDYLLVFPQVEAGSRAVYSEYARSANHADDLPPSLHKSRNDLTAAAIQLYPQIAQTAQLLYDAAGEARLSGSGATLFAAFNSVNAAREVQSKLPSSIISHVAKLLRHHPLDGYQWGVAKW